MKGNEIMRKVTQEIIRAFMNDENKSVSNSTVKTDLENTKMFLFGNLIARKEKATGKIEISMAGYGTTTTRERLNAIPGVRVYQKGGIQYLNGNPINTNEFYAVN